MEVTPHHPHLVPCVAVEATVAVSSFVLSSVATPGSSARSNARSQMTRQIVRELRNPRNNTERSCQGPTTRTRRAVTFATSMGCRSGEAARMFSIDLATWCLRNSRHCCGLRDASSRRCIRSLRCCRRPSNSASWMASSSRLRFCSLGHPASGRRQAVSDYEFSPIPLSGLEA
jgi:hypothetical protein